MSDREQRNENREMVADIVKELRRQSDSESKLATQLRKTDDDVDFALASCYAEDAKYISKIVDRIEAAWANESKAIATEHAVLPAVCITKAPGDTAAMRAALKATLPIMRDCPFTHYNTTEVDSVVGMIDRAISAPPRNCDVGTLTEQQQRFHDFCEKMQHTDKACCGGCPIVHLRMRGVISNSCELAWSQMPYEADEKGESDGRK